MKLPRTAVLLNPKSGHIRNNLATLPARFQSLGAALFYQADDPASLSEALTALTSANVATLVIAGGDGTIQAVIDFLSKNQPSDRWPELILFPGGTTNMTCGELGLPGGSVEQAFTRLETLLARPERGHRIARSALAVATPGQSPVHGFFLGLGLVARGVEFSRGEVKNLRLTGKLFSVLIFLRSLLGVLSGKDDPNWRPCELAFSGSELPDGRYLMALITTLKQLEFGLSPFWGTQQGAIGGTFLQHPPRRLLSRLWPLAHGRAKPGDSELGYHSLNFSELTLNIDDGFIVDGESYRACGSLNIRHTPPFHFLR